jgi:hypothetical protein
VSYESGVTDDDDDLIYLVSEDLNHEFAEARFSAVRIPLYAFDEIS